MSYVVVMIAGGLILFLNNRKNKLLTAQGNQNTDTSRNFTTISNNTLSGMRAFCQESAVSLSAVIFALVCLPMAFAQKGSLKIFDEMLNISAGTTNYIINNGFNVCLLSMGGIGNILCLPNTLRICGIMNLAALSLIF